ncbi:Late embryogenesis abundant protein [Quillaja saponaria]|nr:Late embryogenesis abundant protein [Quillaja saponaria]
MLDANSSQTLFVSSVFTLTLNAQNQNKVGIGYSSSNFHVYYDGFPVGLIRIPRFFQPAHSNNVSVETRVLLRCVNLSKITSAVSLQDKSRENIAQMKILGDVRAHLWVFHTSLLEIKVGVDCDINIDLSKISFTNEIFISKGIKNHLASFLKNSNIMSMNCALAFYI